MGRLLTIQIPYRNLKQSKQKFIVKNLLITSLLGILLIGLGGCLKPMLATGTLPEKDYKVIVIDNCQYIAAENGVPDVRNYNLTITHKGNCNNPIHIYNVKN